MNIKIKHPAGVPMIFTESLIAHIASMTSTKPFVVGDWLASLSNVETESLAVLSELYISRADGREVDDLIGVTIYASHAEKRTTLKQKLRRIKKIADLFDMSSSEDEILQSADKFIECLATEIARRDGLITINGKIRIHSTQGDSFNLTPKGLALEESLKKLH